MARALRKPVPVDDLYERDFHEWTVQTAELLRGQKFGELDLPNLIDEVQSLGISQRNELASRLRVAIWHLLKCGWTQRAPSKSWLLTLLEQRAQIGRLVRSSPSLRRMVDAEVSEAWPRAAKSATLELGLSSNPFPHECPFAPEQILDEDFIPEPGSLRRRRQ